MAKTPARNAPITHNTPHLIGTQEKQEKIVRLTLELPESVVRHYEEQAKAWDRTLEHEIMTRLQRCRTHVSTSPLYFTDDERHELEKALGHNFGSDSARAVAMLTRSVIVKVNDIEIEIPARVWNRLPSRVFRGETLASVVKREMILALERFCGLRP